MKCFRQGDVLIRHGKLPEEVELSKSLVLAEGEVTGHAHRIVQGNAQLFKTLAGVMFLRVLSEHAKLFHEEHEDIDLPIGDYEIKIQREWDWFSEEVRRVAD